MPADDAPDKPFRALVLHESEGSVEAGLTELSTADLPDGDVTVAVEWSSFNYKDGMVLQGLGRLVRDYPHVPGIDLAGTVLASASDRFNPGDQVLLTGWRVGEAHWGGYAERARVKADWLTPLPERLTTRQAMAVGTAGFTAMQALLALEDHGLSPDSDSSLLVTGASGGVGSSAILWASALGHRVVASTGRVANADELTALGAAEVIDRAELADNPSRPLLKERWHGCIDAVGGDTLAHVLAEMAYGSSVAACGLAGGNGLATTVIPFLLRGVNLLGIDSVMCPPERRNRIWQRIADAMEAADLDAKLESLTSEVALENVVELAPKIIDGQIKGRVVVACGASANSATP
jgi:acrylyl-CoA reductase (NADPH)